MMRRAFASSLIVLLACPIAALAGVYRGSTIIRTSIVTHPVGYDGTGGPLAVAVCVRPGDEILTPFVEETLSLWNDLTPTVGNCSGCITTEEFAGMQGSPPMLSDLLGTMIHEFGHCGLGLDHTTWDVTSASNADDATSVSPCNVTPCPVDAIFGDFDDVLQPVPPDNPAARIVHWFKADPANVPNANNPFVIDGTVIDEDTWTRQRFMLPSGHTWVTNANRLVGDRFGFPNTHSAMYTFSFGGEQLFSLTPDDVSTVKFSQTGRDKIAGTADDYTTTFSLVGDCSMADIEIQWVAASTDPTLGTDTNGQCESDIQPIPGEPIPAQHYAVEGIGMRRIVLKMNSERPWRVLTPILIDGFESGDTSAWSQVVP